jgi:hypothetical protein
MDERVWTLLRRVEFWEAGFGARVQVGYFPGGFVSD